MTEAAAPPVDRLTRLERIVSVLADYALSSEGLHSTAWKRLHDAVHAPIAAEAPATDETVRLRVSLAKMTVARASDVAEAEERAALWVLEHYWNNALQYMPVATAAERASLAARICAEARAKESR